MSEVPMIEQREGDKIQPKEKNPTVGANAFVKSADATWVSRFKNLVSEKARKILELSIKKIEEPAKKGVQNAALTGAALSYLISSGCGNVEKQTPPPPTPTAAVSELPTGMPSEVEFQRLTTPTPEPPSISTPTPEPTLAPTPVPIIEATPPTTGIEQPADVESRFQAVGMETFLPFYMEASGITNKYGADLNYFDVLNVSNAVAKGEIVDRDNPRLIEIRDGWGIEKEHAVEKALEHVNNITIMVEHDLKDDPEEVREKLLRPFARSFAPLARALPNRLIINPQEGFSGHDSLMTSTLEVGLNGALPVFWHEVNHAADGYPARLKSLVPQETYLEYLKSYFQISDDLLTQWFSIQEEEKGQEFWLHRGQGYAWGPSLPLEVKEHTALSTAIATEFFDKSPSETNHPLLFESVAWHVGRRLMDIRERQSRQESLTSQDQAFLKDPRVTKFMGKVLYETIHFLVRPYEDFTVESPEEYNSLPKGFLGEAQKRMHEARIAAFATFPIDPNQEIGSQIRQQFGLKPVTVERPQTLTPTPATETPTPTVEIQQPKVISMGGSVEPDPASQSAGETIKLQFPEGTVDGESPLIPKGDTLSTSFRLKSVTPIQQLSLSVSKLMGIESNELIVITDNTKEGSTTDIDIASAVSAFQRVAKFSISDVDQNIIKKIKFTSLRDSNGGVMVSLSLPNQPFTYIDKDGSSRLVNPAERFASGKVGLGINRRGKSASGTATTPIALAVEDVKIANSKGELVAIADRFDITPPQTPVPTRPPEATQVPVKSPSPTIEATKIPTPNPKEESKWTERSWAPNETVPVQEWWNDMVAKGYISIDAVAQQYAGKRIYDFLESADLVPNPVRYGYGGGPSFINNCNLKLDELVTQGQGHIKITSDAYKQIPGANGCQIYTKQQIQPEHK